MCSVPGEEASDLREVSPFILSHAEVAELSACSVPGGDRAGRTTGPLKEQPRSRPSCLLPAARLDSPPPQEGLEVSETSQVLNQLKVQPLLGQTTLPWAEGGMGGPTCSRVMVWEKPCPLGTVAGRSCPPASWDTVSPAALGETTFQGPQERWQGGIGYRCLQDVG